MAEMPAYSSTYRRRSSPPTCPACRATHSNVSSTLAPTFDHMISLGQSNTIISCPAFTTHSELDEAALAEAGISSTTIRYAIGDEDPKDLIAHFIAAAKLTLGEEFAGKFMSPAQIDALVRDCYLDTHKKYIESRPNFSL
jgi:O-acetylhomoserine (thiol)-lyase